MVEFIKCLKMVLQKDSKFGLTFGQLLSLIAVSGGILAAWISINVRIAQAEIKIQELENGRITNALNIERIRQENREDHKEIMMKLDNVIQNTRR